MIITELYNGQGLGNQLFAYVMTRVLARDKGYDFGIMSPEKFKGGELFSLDFGTPVLGGSSPYEGAPPTTLPQGITQYYAEKQILHPDGTDVRSYDPDIATISDNTKIDGLFQGEDYFKHRKDEIREWLHVPIYPAEPNLCIINFRGGEYVGARNLFLGKSYWNKAIAHMREANPQMNFRVVTDDVKAAKKFFPTFPISHNLKDDYIAIQSAAYLILSNSSFAFFPAWLNTQAKLIIAPKYWARHNVSDGYWSCEYNIVKGWIYQDRAGILHDSSSCVQDLVAYKTGILDTTSPTFPPPTFRTMIAAILPKRIRLLLRKILS